MHFANWLLTQAALAQGGGRVLRRRDDRLRGMDLQDFSPDRISFVSSGTAAADAAMGRLRGLYGDCGADKADVIVALGGDRRTTRASLDRSSASAEGGSA